MPPPLLPHGLNVSLKSDSGVPGKRVANNYAITISPAYMTKILAGFRGKGAAEFFRQYTDDLWQPPFSEMTCADYGAVRRILSMFARSKAALRDNMIVVTAKELKMYGISIPRLRRLCTKWNVFDISLLTESGEIKDL